MPEHSVKEPPRAIKLPRRRCNASPGWLAAPGRPSSRTRCRGAGAMAGRTQDRSLEPYRGTTSQDDQPLRRQQTGAAGSIGAAVIPSRELVFGHHAEQPCLQPGTHPVRDDAGREAQTRIAHAPESIATMRPPGTRAACCVASAAAHRWDVLEHLPADHEIEAVLRRRQASDRCRRRESRRRRRLRRGGVRHLTRQARRRVHPAAYGVARDRWSAHPSLHPGLRAPGRKSGEGLGPERAPATDRGSGVGKARLYGCTTHGISHIPGVPSVLACSAPGSSARPSHGSINQLVTHQARTHNGDRPAVDASGSRGRGPKSPSPRIHAIVAGNTAASSYGRGSAIRISGPGSKGIGVSRLSSRKLVSGARTPARRHIPYLAATRSTAGEPSGEADGDPSR